MWNFLPAVYKKNSEMVHDISEFFIGTSIKYSGEIYIASISFLLLEYPVSGILISIDSFCPSSLQKCSMGIVTSRLGHMTGQTTAAWQIYISGL